ncbi:hypothetical protein ONS95_014007 [Cadophora gregata]|uniref:uncharacterized protein n=1 Tax=Cadophora gregata TaxID=51156 RepID=UPI0026DC886F|nr:uncharacterized protein ONS95_014007 [Cadophora gregata]KAK0113757.1 hypothetical protein ONS96_014613 [Cadophora gregata f. sp. sojae]KAK0114517.1 hypothetical protein ONS95_014007 [Cadophora gregata]
MPQETPEFHTKTLSPVSPLPIHPVEPSNISVLRNQTDPIFNMTSTHLDPAPPSPAVAATAEHSSDSIPVKPDSPSAESSFSDAYKEESEKEMEEKKDTIVNESSDVSDDYAMTFDSEGEERADSGDIAQANIEPEPTSLPAQTTLSSPPVPSIDTSIAQNAFQPGPAAIPIPPSPSTLPSTAHASEGSDASTAPIPMDTTETTPHTYEAIASGDIDIQQLLDNITANAEKNESTTAATNPITQPSASIPKASSGLPTHSSLPPRPNLPHKRPYDDHPKYHANAPGLPTAASSYRPPGVASALIAAGAPGTSTDPRSGLPPPPTASFRPPPPSVLSPINQASSSQINRLSAAQGQQTQSVESQEEADEIDAKWGPEVQKVYDEFLDNERMYVTEGLWDRFPLNSRLFIGNLPSEKVTKRDIFHVFHPYGKIAQISIKQAYGFVQFHDSSACFAALDREQGAEVRGKRMHLEISKPQKSTRNTSSTATTVVRRSRSPDYSRGSMPDRGGRHPQGGRNGDRYDGRSGQQPMRQDEYGRPLRMRDDYRPLRQVTPPRGNPRSRDEYPPRRDSYDGRERRRSRSPPAGYGNRDNGRYRERSLSPRAREALEDEDLQIPRRDPRAVPDVQIILLDQLDRAFVSWVESEMRSRGVNVEVMFLSPRLPLQAVIRRQIIEGVHAVSKLDMRSQNQSKISLQVFDRQGGANNVRFDEYQDLDPKIAAELVIRAKHTPPQVHQPQAYAPPQYAPVQPPYQQPAPAPVTPNLASLVGQLDNATLQKLLSTLQPQQQQNNHAVAANSSIDLAGLLGGFAPQPPQQQNYQPQPQPQPQHQPAADPYANLAINPALASLLGNGAPAQQPVQTQTPAQTAPQQQVQNIMAQLARFRQ